MACAIEVGRNVTTEFELEAIWEVYEPTLQSHLENVTNCLSAGDNATIQICFDDETQAAVATYREFVAAVKVVCPSVEMEKIEFDFGK